ncbi:PASTA domain-containing protein [Streptomyces prunicolor]|uniref:PASTA domain-containing protein n=1 Tax=Streptomyces prunicolor TaxID=67348 RepID=A0ABU4F8W9_9ACTN|nr:PASTA domain-containing protein [Streptomyces prunicolor]MDV7216540.1 PASTA domain-containing protein [Streptomyces prunicolor]
MRKFLVAVVIIAALLALSNHSKRQRAALPDLRGLTLSHALDRARAQGFNRVESQDAGPEDRPQLLAGDWTVCSQIPGPGTHAVTALVAVTVVKSGEGCPRA